MNIKNKITIPEPCHEDWNKMTPKDNGRFCLSCVKIVVDFTKMLPEEIQQYFVSNQNQNICGRFKNTQLDEVIVQIPNRVLYSQTHYSKMFLLALFIAMGTTLFSCTDKNGDKQKIDKVEVVKTSKAEHTQVGDIKVSSNSLNPPPPPPPKVDQVKFVNPTNITKEQKTKSNKTDVKKTVTEEESSFTTGAIMHTNAEFPGGIDQFYTFFGKEFKKPEQSEVSKIKISFAVEKNGSVTYLQSEPEIDEPLEKEIIRVLKVCPKWQAGESGGKKIKMQYSLPIVLQ